MKKVISIIIAIVLIAGTTACGTGNNAVSDSNSSSANGSAETEWVQLDLSVAEVFPEDNIANNVIKLLQEKIDERMDGAIQFTIYGNGTLVGGPEIYDGVINGSADVGFYQTNYSSGRFPLANLCEYPIVSYTGSKAASYTFREFCNTLQPEELSDVHVMFYSATGSSVITSSSKLESMNDLKGKQIRATSINASILSACGSTPVSMDMGEVYEGLRTGLIDGCSTIIDAVANNNLYEVSPNVMVSPLSNQCNIIIMNKGIYESMPQAQRELFDTLCDEVFEEFTSSYLGNPTYDTRIQTAIKNLDSLTFLEGDALDEAIKACASITDDYIKTLNAKGIDGDAALKQLKEIADKYNKLYAADDTKSLYEQYR